MAILTSYKNVSVGYIELKLHIYALGTSEAYFTSCKKGHNRSPLKTFKSPLQTCSQVSEVQVQVKSQVFEVKSKSSLKSLKRSPSQVLSL